VAKTRTSLTSCNDRFYLFNRKATIEFVEWSSICFRFADVFFVFFVWVVVVGVLCAQSRLGVVFGLYFMFGLCFGVYLVVVVVVDCVFSTLLLTFSKWF